MSKKARKLISMLLCFTMLFSCVGVSPAFAASGSVNVGTNPTPVVDIAVNVPDDYPGTFLEFKQELTQKLIEQGMPEGSFRITNTDISIDTANLDGWYVYDHYYNKAQYDALNLSKDQQNIQPFRQADNSCIKTNHSSPRPVGIPAVFIPGVNNTVYNTAYARTQLWYFNRHIHSYQSEGKTNMIFAGYGTNSMIDFMLYPAASKSKRTFSFDLDAAAVGNHTLDQAGFLLNAGVSKNAKGEYQYLTGYALSFTPPSGTNSTAYIKKFSNYNLFTNITADTAASPSSSKTHESMMSAQSTTQSGQTIDLGSKKKIRLTVELTEKTVNVQYQIYDGQGNLGDVKQLFGGAVTLPESTGYNGFGPIVSYTTHGCEEMTSFQYLDLEMKYAASAFDALKNVQYYEGAEYKYFINLVGDSNDPQIPKEQDKDYKDGINRLNENEIFYVSNVDDGKVLTNTVKDENGETTHLGLGSENGFIAAGDNYAELMAQYIYTNYTEGNHFKPAPVDSDIPLANFYVLNKDNNTQLMTIHQQHLVNLKKAGLNPTVTVNIVDKSKPGTTAQTKDESGAITDEGRIAKWNYKVYDPDGTVVRDSGWVDSPDKIPDYTFDENSKAGRYTFELTVQDQKYDEAAPIDKEKHESKTFQTYLIAFLDNVAPYIEGANSGKNTATITLTDQGDGIADDGITLIHENRGSGVQYYWVTDNEKDQPTDDDWIAVPNGPTHTFAFDVPVESLDPIVVWVKDECSNVGSQAIFKPKHVIVEDEDGNEIDDYYVIGDKPIIVLPDEAPDSEDEDNKFSGWHVDGDPITPGTEVDMPENTIVIRPSYSKDKAYIVYVANGGEIVNHGVSKPTDSYEVISNASIETKIKSHDVQPVREGYKFIGWKLLDTGENKLEDTAYINDANHLLDVKGQLATKVVNEDTNELIRDQYYLIAQWEVSSYVLKLDANGGSLGNVSSIEDVPYGTVIANLTTIPTQGRGLPTKPGYIFQGWSATSGSNEGNVFKYATGVTGTIAESPVMPAANKTIYAVWKADTNKFVVSFDSNGGSRVSDQAYLTATATKYNTFMKPNRAGYNFDGWYLLNEDGSLGETAYVGGENLIKKANHTFVAKWTPRDDTKYTIDYYYNTGKMNEDGTYQYVKASTETVSKTGTTEATVSVPEDCYKDVITVDGANYWYNAENALNSEENHTGVITGNPTLSLKLYYDRYFKVDAQATNGAITSEDDLNSIKEGSSATVTWEANEGYKVKSVFIDGVARDDLLAIGTYTFEDVLANHVVKVICVKESSTEEPGGDNPGDDNPGEDKPGGDKPKPPTEEEKPDGTGGLPAIEEPEDSFVIATRVKGGSGKTTITPKTTVKKGDNHLVEWDLEEGYELISVEVNGNDVTDTNPNNVSFVGIHADYEVVITLGTRPSLGGNSTPGYYTITVNKYGGDDSCTVSDSAVVSKGDEYTAKWNAGEGYNVEVYVNGLLQTGMKNEREFKGIKANYVVDVYFTKIQNPDDNPGGDNPGENPGEKPEDPNKTVNITTQIIGGPGKITGGKNNVELESSEEVSWTIRDEDWILEHGTDPADEDYAVFEVEKIVVNGEVVEAEADGSYELTNITEDQDVKVYVKPIQFTVQVFTKCFDVAESDVDGYLEKKTNGVATPVKNITLYKGQGCDITGEVLNNADAKIVRVKVDGEIVYDVTGKQTEEPEPEPQPVVEEEAEQQEELQESEQPEQQEQQEQQEELAEADEVITYSESLVSFSRKMLSTTGSALEVTPDAAAPVQRVPMKAEANVGYAASDNSEVSYDYEGKTDLTDTKLEVKNISSDHEILVVFAGQDADVPPDDQMVTVSASIIGGDSSAMITGGEGVFVVGKDGEDKTTVEWTFDTKKYQVKEILVNGESYALGEGDESIQALPFESLTEDTKVVVVLENKYSKPEDAVVTGGEKTVGKNYVITGEIKSALGATLDGVDVEVLEHGDKTVSWTIPEGYSLWSVIVDGKVVEFNKDTRSYEFKDLTENHNIEILIGRNNVDTNNDGIPDKNIDTDDDGVPDVNIDTDGNGEPDINIVDKDGDGKPDPIDPNDIDPDNPPKPNVNVDTDGDGKPDVNVDTDEDGIPDINIVDEDGDGVPDPVDPKDPNPPKPNVNVDTNDDGKPDVNVDEDGDGIPDVNIVDEDGDGKPDPVDPKDPNPPKPNKNIDKDGPDGKPDGRPDPDKNDENTIIPGSWYLVTTFINEEIKDQLYVKPKEDYKREVTVPNGYRLKTVTVNGVERPDLIQNGELNLEGIEEDSIIKIVLEKVADDDYGWSGGGVLVKPVKPDKEDEKLKEEQKEEQQKDPAQTNPDGTTIVDGTLVDVDGVKSPSAEEEAAKLLADKEAPRTGDEHAAGFFAMLMLLAVSALAVLNRRKEDSEA